MMVVVIMTVVQRNAPITSVEGGENKPERREKIMEKCNQSLREELKEKNVPYWQIAKFVGVCENTIVRWLRVPLTAEQAERIQVAVNRIVESRNGGVGNADSTYQQM